MKKIFILGLITLLGVINSNFLFSQTFYSLSGSNYSQNFSNISSWTNNYASGTGAENWRVATSVTGSTVNTATVFAATTSGGVQKGSENMVLLATGTNSSATDLLLNFTGRTAGTISLNWAKVTNSANNTDPRSSDLKIQYSINNGTSFTDLTGYSIPRVLNNSTSESGMLSATLPSALDGQAQVIIRFYVWNNGQTSGGGNRPKISIDDIAITSTASGTPTLTVSPSTLSGFTYIEGNGPSASQTYTLSGSSLTPSAGNITVTGTTNYEVSIDGVSFAGSFDVPYTGGALPNTTIYVRLKAGLSVATYNSELVTNDGGGATIKNVTCNGSVTAPPPPTITVTPTTLSGFTYLGGSGPSTSQSYSVSAANLSPAADFITITAPTNYEISEDNVSFAGSITLGYSGGALASTTIRVRLKAGLIPGNYNSEVVTHTGGGASANVTCNGTVTVPPAHYRTKASGDWTDAIWEYSTDLIAWADAPSAPTTTDLSITLTSPNNITISANRSVDQLVIQTGSTLDITGGTLTVADGTGTDLLVQGTLRNSTTSAFTLSGSANIVVDNGGTYEHNPSSGAGVYTAMTWEDGSTCKVTRSTSSTTTMNQNYYHFTWASTNHGVTTLNLSGALDNVRGDFRLENTGTGSLRLTGSTSSELIVGGDAFIAAGTQLQLGNGGAASALTVAGDLTINGTLDMMNGSSATGTVSVKGDVIMGGSAVLVENNSSTDHLLKLNGTSNQTVNFTTISTNINLEIDNTAGVTLASDASTFRNLTLTNGIVKTNGFTLGISGTVTGQSASNFVCTCNAAGTTPATAGGLRRPVAASSSVVFPVGPTSSYYMPATIASAVSHTLDNLTARVETLGTGGVSAFEPAKCIQYQWNINEAVAGGSNVSLKLQWAAGTEGSSFNPGVSPQIGHWDGSGFDPIIPATYNASDPSFTSSANFTAFSPFVAASEAAALPIELLSFNVSKVQRTALLSFSTASERNNSHFEIERSTDGRSFEKIGEVKGAGDSQVAVHYSYTDRQPARGMNYYRLRQVDFDGVATLSKVVSLQFGQTGGVTLFPTPVAESMNVRFDEAFATDANWQVVDVNGRVVSEGIFAAEQKDFSIPVATLAQGAYVLRVTSGQQTIAQQFRKL